MHITSIQNPRIKGLLRLRTNSRQRQRGGLFLVEGIDEIRLALGAGHRAEAIISAPDITRRELGETEGARFTVTDGIFNKLSFRENPDGWLGVFQRPVTQLADVRLSEPALLMVMESLEKPGNLGAILRTADATALDAVLVCDERADIYSPNVVRASRGALFSVPVVEISSQEGMDFVRERGIRVVAANPNAGIDYQQADLSGSVAIALGTEDAGLSDFWLRKADVQVRIPMRGRVNSLNVSVAAALLLYEALRQRGA
jgi:TrmH family RNA methyltransferase